MRFHGSVAGDGGALAVPEEIARGLTNRPLAGETGSLHFDDWITGADVLEAAACIAALLARLGLTATVKRSRLITPGTSPSTSLPRSATPSSGATASGISIPGRGGAHHDRNVWDRGVHLRTELPRRPQRAPGTG